MAAIPADGLAVPDPVRTRSEPGLAEQGDVGVELLQSLPGSRLRMFPLVQVPYDCCPGFRTARRLGRRGHGWSGLSVGGTETNR
jgi:hypothetical protein